MDVAATVIVSDPLTMNGTHYPPLVALSVLIAICASYTALTLAGRVAAARGRSRVAWLSCGSIAMGSGIWSMHFVAMLAFHLPIAISYDVTLVAMSFLAAVGASAFALFVASRASVGTTRLLAAGTCLGIAVVTMHYTGMAALRVPAHLFYEPVLVAASVLVAITAATVALWLFLWLRNNDTPRGRWLRIAAAVVMGLAIAGMHYTAMAAAHFMPAADTLPSHGGRLLEASGLAVPVVMGAFIILSLTVGGSITDRWVRAQLQAADTAQAASRAKSEFLSRMSHELRTPLNAILGFGQLMELEAATPTQSENAEHILKAGRHLLSLINEVLDITSIESGRLNISAEPVSVSEVVEEIVALIGPLTVAGNIDLQIDDASVSAHYVHADRQRLKQVLLNLVANAVKYNRRDGRVRIRCVTSAADRVQITVEDTGIGIAPDKISRLFTPFDRLGAEQTGVEGTGLGLALSKSLAEAMDGHIRVTSAPDAGSTFAVDLPRAESQLQRLARLEPASAIVAGTHAHPHVRTVLYVEDNLSNLALVQRILATRTDIRLIPAMQGGLALELARLHRPDLVLLDVHLPDIPGEEVCRQLKQSPDCGSIPVVVLSADATTAQMDRMLAAGALAYVTKPLDVTPFMRILDEALGARRAA